MPGSTDPREAAGEVDVLDAVTRAIATLEAHHDPIVRAATESLLTGIDAVHRAGLTHLVQGIQGLAGEAFLNRLVGDPAIRLLLMSYNLIAVDRRLHAEEAIDAVRGHLHDHGVDVEIAEVVGGVVYVSLHRSHRAAEGCALLEEAALRRDLEAALRQGFLGFQELVLHPRDDAAGAAAIPVSILRRARRPVYFDAGPADLADGAIRAASVHGVAVLLAAVAGEVYALHNRCGDSPLPLEFGRLDGTVLRCSWHGCPYDVRTGHRLDGGSDHLQVFPVTVDDGRIRVALDVEPAAKET